MSLDDGVRETIVEALDELGERDRLRYAQRTSWGKPYPPLFVAERLDAIRRDHRRTKRLLLAILGGVAVVTSLGLWLGWPRELLAPLPLVLVIPQFPTFYTLIRTGKAEQLYALLHKFEGTTEEAPESVPAEAS